MTLLGGGLASSKSVKFTEVIPGSTIRVDSLIGAHDPFEATVIEVRKEYGPQNNPALIYTTEQDSQPQILMDTGNDRITVLLSAAALMGGEQSRDVVTAIANPVEVRALQFTGGPTRATEIIKFVAGRVILRWQPEQDRSPECLILRTLESEQRIEVGSYVLVTPEKVWFESSESFATGYEITVDNRGSLVLGQ